MDENELLGIDVRSSWCGDTDPTGRYVCQRIRDHALDWHAGRNDAGGIHQWKAADAGERRENMPASIPATNPADDPIGTVRVHPDDDHLAPDARRRIAVDASDYCGPYEGCRWQRLTGAGIHDGGSDPIHSSHVADWPRQPVAELAIVLQHPTAWPPDLAAKLEKLRTTNESLLAMLERMETLHVTFRGPDGEEYHPDWCRECRVDKVRAELADLRTSLVRVAREFDSLHGKYTLGPSNALRVVGLLLEDISKTCAELRKAAGTTNEERAVRHHGGAR